MAGFGVAVVSGSNKGIGFAIVRGLCRQFKGDVYLTSRDEQRGREAVAKLESEGLNPKYHQLDITSVESIERLKQFLLEKYGGVDVLVNNAGIACKVESTLEQATVTIRTNFTGTLDTMKAFVPIIKPGGRIVNVSSALGLLSRLTSQSLRDQFSKPSLTLAELVTLMEAYVADVRDGSAEEKGWGDSRHHHYSISKVGETAMTKVFAREMAASGRDDVLINACCPGWVKTDLAGDKALLTPDQGAETPILLALLPPGSPSGEFWRKKAVDVW